jgi:hypothetical protein
VTMRSRASLGNSVAFLMQLLVWHSILFATPPPVKIASPHPLPTTLLAAVAATRTPMCQ